MKRHLRFNARRTLTAPALALWLAVVGCASAMPRQSMGPEPVSCTGSSLMELRAEHSDSLSARGRQRLKALERECSLDREAAAREDGRRSADHHMLWIGSGLVMALMMLMVWIA